MADRSAPGTVTGRAGRLVAVLMAAVAVVVAACDEPSSTTRPSPSLVEVQFTPRSTAGTGPGSPAPTDDATFVSLPVGWDDAFCEVFSDAVVAQELVIDVDRALDEENFRDARALARELREVTADAAAGLAELPAWEPASDATAAIASLVDLGARAGAEYGTWFADQDARNALRRARALRRQVAAETPAANDALAELAGVGITCTGLELVLEQP